MACSEYVQVEYNDNREKFLISVMNDPYYIENICGVEKIINDIDLRDIDLGDDF